MASFKYKPDLTSLPPKICCDVGKEWKALDGFSNKKLQKFASGLRGSGKVTAAESGIACRVHSGEPQALLKCEGPCGKAYGLEHFSKSTRVKHIYWCMDCTRWACMDNPAPLIFQGQETVEKRVGVSHELADEDTLSVTSSIAPSISGSDEVSPSASGPDEGSPGVVSDQISNLSSSTYALTPDSSIDGGDTSSAPPRAAGRSGWTTPNMRKTGLGMQDSLEMTAWAASMVDYYSDDGFHSDDGFYSDDGLSDDEI